MEMIPDVEYKTALLRKLSPPLVTLLSSEAEVQYVALRNINLIVQKRPEILKHEIKVHFLFKNNINIIYKKVSRAFNFKAFLGLILHRPPYKRTGDKQDRRFFGARILSCF